MSFYRKYELERLVQKAEPKTFRAHEVAGGRPVFLHLLAGMDAPSRASLLQRVRSLMAAANPVILDMDDNEFAPYVVTAVLEDFDGLPAWLSRLPDARSTETMARPTAPPPRPAPPPLVETAPAAGEFTVRFGSGPPSASQQQPAPPRAPAPAPPSFRAPAPPPPAPAPQAMPSAAAAPGIEAGEFTRMFTGSPSRPASPAPSPAPPPTPRVPVAPAAPAGSEFSKLFGSGPIGQPSPPAGGDEPGEFSRLFGAPPGTPSDNPAGFAPQAAARERPADPPLPWELQPAAPPPGAAPPTPQFASAPSRPVIETPDSQKVQVYNPPSAPPAPPPAPPAMDQSASMWNSAPAQNRPDHAGPGEFTRFFASPLASSSLPIEEIEQGRMPEAKAPVDRPFDGPGEFTRWFGKSVPGESSGTPPPSPPAQYPTYAGRATGLFEMPHVPNPPAGGTPAPPKGPSEYTGIMAAPRIDEPAAYVPSAAPGKGPLVIIIVVIAVVMVALIIMLILYFRH